MSSGELAFAPAAGIGAVPTRRARCRAAATIIGVATATLGLGVLVAWAAGVHLVPGIPGGGWLMKPNAALGFLLNGAALALASREGRAGRLASRALAAAAVALAVATLFEWVTGVQLGIDEALFRDDTRAYTTVPGRIAPNTALAFSFAGVALLLVRSSGRRLRVAQALALLAMAVGAVAFAGYVYGVSALFAVARQTGMAFLAAIGLVVLSCGVLLARPDSGPAALLAADGEGGALARTLLPVAALVPLALALPAQLGVRLVLFDQAYASALVTVGLTLVLAWVVVNSARAVEARDVARRETAARLAARDAELVRMNAELRRHASQLAQANGELEAFSYSVSHDLRSPLRSIDGFGQALVEDCGAALPPAGQEHVKRIRAATQRMGRLIDDLLQLARVARAEIRRQPVHLSQLAREIAADLARTAPDRRVAFEIEGGLVAQGDPVLLRLVLENLLGNAWKFTSKHETGRIAFGRAARDGVPAFFVRDDGSGFDMAYATKLFGAFQRLHAATEFPGTGVGLATVKRIVARHGGEIDAEGAVEQGATFTFTLPPDPERPGEGEGVSG
jgi:signal transduction histidine kinase